jgi:hypothetical protein
MAKKSKLHENLLEYKGINNARLQDIQDQLTMLITEKKTLTEVIADIDEILAQS